MNDMAYDISHLLEPEMAQLEAPTQRMAKAPPAMSAASAGQAAQEALARELLQVADTHEALIQQYLRMSSEPSRTAAPPEVPSAAGTMPLLSQT